MGVVTLGNLCPCHISLVTMCIEGGKKMRDARVRKEREAEGGRQRAGAKNIHKSR